MSKQYSDITDRISDLMGNANFVSNRENETLRAINLSLDRINIGDTGEDNIKINEREVGYDFQKEVADVNFDSDYSDYTLSSSLNIKFPDDLRIKTDINTEFNYEESDYYFRKAGVYASKERMYTITYEGGVKILKINYDTTDTLELDYFSEYLVADADGTNRAINFPDITSSRILLIPDRFWQVVPLFASAELARQQFEATSVLTDRYEREGIRLLKLMINSIGKIRQKPNKKIRVRPNWPNSLRRLSTR